MHIADKYTFSFLPVTASSAATEVCLVLDLMYEHFKAFMDVMHQTLDFFLLDERKLHNMRYPKMC